MDHSASPGFTVRPITRDDLALIPSKCWQSAEVQQILLQEQNILGFAAWDADQCIGSLHCYRVMPPAWDSPLFPEYGRREPHAWPLGWPLQAAQKHGISGPLWCNACFHVGLKLGFRDADPTLFRRGIGKALCRASLLWAQGNRYAAVLGIAGSNAIPDYNVMMGCLPVKVYEELGFRSLAWECEDNQLPWWTDKFSPAVAEQVQQVLKNGGSARDVCARAMLFSC